MIPPPYFENIRKTTERRWRQLEDDPELAAPWYQLFKQVQSPRHVVSELLQNADDAGAKEATIRICGDTFQFEHRGADFTDKNFASLCGFGRSNKRSLHTIGFRGIGFKSTFSLGNRVSLCTPSLSVVFAKERFTLPTWVERTAPCECTQVSVQLTDKLRRSELEKNLTEWLKSPVSLLFFKNIRKLTVGDQTVGWKVKSPGPFKGSNWMSRLDRPELTVLLIQSEPEPFPEESINEIREERLLLSGEDFDFPPCSVELVLGTDGRLYVVLPTGVNTPLPFACNAPFIQDPARLKIKDPSTSPTNRWLLERLGNLAANSMIMWLGNESLPETTRAQSYELLPRINDDDDTLEASVAEIVTDQFVSSIEGQKVLLTSAGKLETRERCIALPPVVLDVWSPNSAADLLGMAGRKPLSAKITGSDRGKLISWGLCEQIEKEGVFKALQEKHVPKPSSWAQLQLLWGYIAPDLTGYWFRYRADSLHIIPVQGQDVLYSAKEVVRIGEKKLLESEDDWRFLSDYLLAVNQNWLRHLTEIRRGAQERKDNSALEAIQSCQALLQKVGLGEASDVSVILDRVAGEVFNGESVPLQTCVRLAHIAARLGATVQSQFRFSTIDLHLRSLDHAVICETAGTREELFPDDYRNAHFLHADYMASFKSCTRDEWTEWVDSGRAGLVQFAPLKLNTIDIYRRSAVEQKVRELGGQTVSFPYKRNYFELVDWDFEDALWSHWSSLAKQDARVWEKICRQVLKHPDRYWNSSARTTLVQVATTGSRQRVTFDSLRPSWVSKLTQLPCLQDTHGVCRKPSDLLRRTAETEPLRDVEPFVDARLDNEATRPILDALGVGSKAISADAIVECLRSLAQSDTPPVSEVEKWYRRLDQFLFTCSTPAYQSINAVFKIEKLILTESGAWVTSDSVFLAPDEDEAPGAEVIRTGVRDLTMWGKLGVSGRPTSDLAFDWLSKLVPNKALSADELRRVRALLPRYARRIWSECQHWLNLQGEWIPIEQLRYSVSMQSLVAFRYLHDWVKQKTADFQKLASEIVLSEPFSSVPTLASAIEEKVQVDSSELHARKRDWLIAVGEHLRRIELDDKAEELRIRNLAQCLVLTVWQTAPHLKVLPYIGGVPAGMERRVDVLWDGTTVYVDNSSKAKLARRVPEEIGKEFARPEVKAALDYAYDRSTDDIAEYFNENFMLATNIDLAELELESDRPQLQDSPATSDSSPTAGLEDTEADSGDVSDPSSDELIEVEEDVQQDAADSSLKVARPTAPKVHKVPLIERWAKALGFQKESSDRFFRSDGTSIVRNHGIFPWELRDRQGELVRAFYVKEHCLDLDPLDLDSEVWGMMEAAAQTHSFVLLDAKGNPVEIGGDQISTMVDRDEVKIYPAKYRLVRIHHDAAKAN